MPAQKKAYVATVHFSFSQCLYLKLHKCNFARITYTRGRGSYPEGVGTYHGEEEETWGNLIPLDLLFRSRQLGRDRLPGPNKPFCDR